MSRLVSAEEARKLLVSSTAGRNGGTMRREHRTLYATIPGEGADSGNVHEYMIGTAHIATGDAALWEASGDLAATVVRLHDILLSAVTAEEARSPCASCGEGCPRGECPKSQRECGHHCNHSWSHDGCCWCGTTFGEGGEETPGAVEAEDGVSKMQRVVYDALISGVKGALPDADLGRIDGAASDGDEFDFTVAEVSIALSMLDDALTEVRAERDRLRDILACERGERAPEGWTWDATCQVWRNATRVYYVRRGEIGTWCWHGEGYEWGRADTAIEAIEAADRAAKESK